MEKITTGVKLKYLTKDFNTLSRTIEKELWQRIHYTQELEPLPLQELKLKNSTLKKELKRAKYLKDKLTSTLFFKHFVLFP